MFLLVKSGLFGSVFWLFQGPLIPAAFTNGYHWAALRFRIFPFFSDPKFGPHRQLQLWLRHHNQNLHLYIHLYIMYINNIFKYLAPAERFTTCCCICLVFAIRSFLPARPLPTYSLIVYFITICLLLLFFVFETIFSGR